MFTLIFMFFHNFMSLHNFNFITLFSITFYLCHEFANDLLIYFYVIINKINLLIIKVIISISYHILYILYIYY